MSSSSSKELPNGQYLKQCLARIDECLTHVDGILEPPNDFLESRLVEECSRFRNSLMAQRHRVVEKLGAYNEALVILGAISTSDLGDGRTFPCLGGYTLRETGEWGAAQIFFDFLAKMGWENLSNGFKSLGWYLGKRQADGSYYLRKQDVKFS